MVDKDPKDMTLEELQEFTADLKAQDEKKDDEHKEAMDEKEKEHKDAMDEEKKNHESQVEHKDDEHKQKMEGLKADLLKAMDEKDDEKKATAMKAVLDAMEDEKKNHEASHKGQEDKKDDEEKKAMKAQITYLTATVNKPKIEYLNKIYTAAKTEDKTLTTWNKEWEAMNSKQLDGAIEKTKPLVETLEYKAVEEEKSPFGFSTAEGPGQKEFSADKKFKSIEDLTDEELFGGGPGIA